MIAYIVRIDNPKRCIYWQHSETKDIHECTKDGEFIITVEHAREVLELVPQAVEVKRLPLFEIGDTYDEPKEPHGERVALDA